MTDNRLFPDYTSVLLPRMLSAIDRDPFSETRGCADRSFWGWKTKDFPDATLSRIALLLHQIDPQKYQNEILWVLEFLRKIQHRDGSFDQAFPNEHSHGATAFLLHDLAEIMLSEPSLLDSFGDILEKNGHYLIKYRETHGQISNHIAGTAAALFGLWKLTKDARYRKTAEDYLHLVLQNQSAEGWYPEYGGADPSYQTLCIDYLASCYEITKQELLLSSLKKAISFVSYFAHPDGSFGGEYGSRNCEIFYPGGIAVLSKYLSEASSLLAWATQSFSKSKTVTPLSVDLENLSPLFSSILQAEKVASTNAADRQSNLLPGDQQPFVQDFPEAGIYIVNQDICYSILSWKKGGIVKSFDKKAKKKVVDDCGIILLKNNRNVATSQFFSQNHTFQTDETTVKMQLATFITHQQQPTPFRFFLLRLLNLTFWRFRCIREAGKKYLVSLLISNRKQTPFYAERTIDFGADIPKISDRLTGGGTKTGNLEIISGKKFSSIHMASSKYYYET